MHVYLLAITIATLMQGSLVNIAIKYIYSTSLNHIARHNYCIIFDNSSFVLKLRGPTQAKFFDKIQNLLEYQKFPVYHIRQQISSERKDTEKYKILQISCEL